MLNKQGRESMRILLLEGIHQNAIDLMHRKGFSNVQVLNGALDEAQLRQKLKEADVVGIRSRTLLTESILSDNPHLQAIGCFCIGTNQVDLKTAQTCGIPVFNAPHANTRSVAELIIGLTVMLMRQIFPRSMELHRGEWKKSAQGCFEIRGKSIGIVGYGHIGSQVSILAEAMGMQVYYYDIEPKLPLGNASAVPSLKDLLAHCDVVSLHVPQTTQTHNMIGADELAIMKHGSVLINASRGQVVQLAPLAKNLKSGHIRGAAIDVFPSEPKTNQDQFDSELIGLEQVILTPHIGGSTQEAQANIAADVATKLMNFCSKGATVGAVNFPALNLEVHANAQRLLHIHHNIPGVLREINRVFANHDINILGQHLNTLGDLGYVVLDIQKGANLDLLAHLDQVKGTIKVRLLA